MTARLRLLLGLVALGGCGPKPPGAAPETACPTPSAVSAPSTDPAPAAGSEHDRPRLVVWLTIDQLRGDSFSRFAHLISKDGVGWLLSNGTYFSAANYAHAITETAPSHATLFTGASPRDHGIVANEWLDPNGQTILSVTDPIATLLGPELDPSESLPDAGRSPKHLLLPTLGDALRQVSLGRSKVVGVSLKDRAAILPAGHSGQAFWLGKKGFVTSRYYGAEVPTALAEHHRDHPLGAYAEGGWPLLLPESAYRSSLERPRLGARAESFPHHAEGRSGAAWLKVTPFGDEATLDLAEHLAQALELGQDDAVDLLSISLSSTDYVGHAYGPESREAEDTFARLDRLLARLWTFMASHVAEGRILYVLSADHGVSESPDSLASAGLPSGRLSKGELEAAARQSLTRAVGSDRYFRAVEMPGVFLDRAAITRDRKDLATLRQRLAEDLSLVPGVYRAYALGQAEDGSEVGGLVREAQLESRSGDVYVVTAPTVQMAEAGVAASHGSPWSYDRHVPIVLCGPGVPRGATLGQPVDVRALAGTVAGLLGVPAPAGAHTERLFFGQVR